MMLRLFQPLFLILAQASDRQLARMVEYLQAENRLLRERLPKRVRVTPAERSRLVKLGKPLGSAIRGLITIVTPRTFSRWLKGEPKDGQPKRQRKPGRPRTPDEIREWVVRMARETGWGYSRILGELKKLGIRAIAKSTVKNILKEHGLDPGPKRGEGTWTDFLKRHAATLYACDFFSKKVVTLRGVVEVFILFFIHVSSRRVHIAGMSTRTTQVWTAERARESLCFLAGYAGERPILLRDHDTKFEGGFDAALWENGVRVQKVGPRAPNLNAVAERWVQTVEHECLDHFVVFGEAHLRYLLDQFLEHYYLERPHQGLGNRTLSGADPPEEVSPTSGEIECQERLGGLLKHYRRRAA
jgi:putative transposase